MGSPIVDTETLSEWLGSPGLVLVDCRYDLKDPDSGFRDYRRGHIPGAVYADLAKDLSGPLTGTNGRHPLPDLDLFAGKLSGWGIDSSKQVVAYDQADGSLAAARLWWMLRFLGHDRGSVLDGGLAKWAREGRPLRAGVERGRPAQFVPRIRKETMVGADEVERMRQDPQHLIVDSRAPERYRGEVEPIDRVAGHIPGAVNRHYLSNVTAEAALRPASELRAEFQRLLSGVPSENAVLYCGSGVTACQNLLAMEHAGLPGARLYVGSWSEWSADPDRPVQVGDGG